MFDNDGIDDLVLLSIEDHNIQDLDEVEMLNLWFECFL